MTLGDFRKQTKDLPDDTKIICTTHNFEMNSNDVDARISISGHKVVSKTFRDAFDGEYYTTEVYEHDESAPKMIKVWG